MDAAIDAAQTGRRGEVPARLYLLTFHLISRGQEITFSFRFSTTIRKCEKLLLAHRPRRRRLLARAGPTPFLLRRRWLCSVSLSARDLGPRTTLKRFLSRDVGRVLIVRFIFYFWLLQESKAQSKQDLPGADVRAAGSRERGVSGVQGAGMTSRVLVLRGPRSPGSSLCFLPPGRRRSCGTPCASLCSLSFKSSKDPAVFLMRAIGGCRALSYYLNRFKDLIKCKDRYK